MGRLDVADLRQAYLEHMMDEPGAPLEPFVERASRGQLGPVEPGALRGFLQALLRDMVGSIRAQAEANPDLAREEGQRVEEAEEEVARLIDLYGAC